MYVQCGTCTDYCDYSPIYILHIFFFNDTATTEIYTLSYTTLFRSLDELTSGGSRLADYVERLVPPVGRHLAAAGARVVGDRKSTRLNSSHSQISYAVFCLKKKKKI